MGTSHKIRVALVGLGFGAEFIPIYLNHPNVEYVGLCDSDERVLAEHADRWSISRRYTDLERILAGDDYDAVHIVTPIYLHAQQAIQVLQSGRHCASTIPAALTLDDLAALVAAQRSSGKNYMMMETAVYTREFLYVKDLRDRGELGSICFVRGAHYQDMENWPWYWRGLPPMHNATHAVSPLLCMLQTRATKVHCFGSGTLRSDLRTQYDNPYPAETAIFQLEGTSVAAEVTRTLFQNARAYMESFNIYADRLSFEWQQIESEPPILFRLEPLQAGRGRPATIQRIEAPDRQDLLPPEIARFTHRTVYDESKPHLSFLQGGGHGGSHPHLAHEFISSITEGREPAVNAVTAANWTAAGVCAHQSAMQDGAEVIIPRFD